jgi:hypothetical protein
VPLAEVHDCLPEIGAEGLGPSEIAEPSRNAHEGVLGEILGQVTIPGKEEGEAHRLGSVRGVEILPPPPALSRHLDAHGRRLVPDWGHCS